MATRRLIQTASILVVMFTASTASAQIVIKQGIPDHLKGLINGKPAPATPPPVDPNYQIGINDVINIQVWKEEGISGDVVVRPDGKITMKYGNDIYAFGLTTEELKEKVIAELKREYKDPSVTIQIAKINSRWVYISGAVGKSGPYELNGPMTVSQLIAIAGGLQEFAKKKEIRFISGTLKDKGGEPLTLNINYEDIEKGRNLSKNDFDLRPGDRIIVR